MNGNDLMVYIIGDKEPGRPGPLPASVGGFVIRELQWFGAPESGALRFSLHFTPDEGIALEGSRFVSVEAEVQTRQSPVRSRGKVIIAPDKRPQLNVTGPQSLEWGWTLLPEDLDAIEAVTPPGDRWRSFTLKISGIVQLSSGTFPVTGSSDFRVPLSEWEDLLRSLGYGVSPAVAQLAGLPATTHPSWADVERRLAPARQALRAGETRRAMTVCLDQFSALADKPYRKQLAP